MAMPLYNYNNFEGVRTISVIVNGEQLIADENHPRFQDIVDKLLIEKDETTDWAGLFSPGIGIRTEFEKLSTEVSIRAGKIFYEGEELHGALADKIVDIYDAGEDYAPFVLFLEKLKENPEVHSVDNLYRWLLADPQGFTIADDGDLIVYKGVNSENKSFHSGNAIRNGEQLIMSQIPNVPGDVIEMDRKDVEHDPSNPCSTGLHVGTWQFVKYYPVILKVKLDPKYVVSVPTDCGGQKMRVCRYQVIEQVTERIQGQYVRGYVEQPVSTHVNDLESDYQAAFTEPEIVPEAPFNVQNIGGQESSQRPETQSVLDLIRDPKGSIGWVDRLGDPKPEDGLTYFPAGEEPLVPRPQVDTRQNYRTQRRGPDGRFLPKPAPQPW